VRHDPPRIVWSGRVWRDVRPAADLQRKEMPAVEVLRDPRYGIIPALEQEKPGADQAPGDTTGGTDSYGRQEVYPDPC
jgi:hypothetical protein